MVAAHAFFKVGWSESGNHVRLSKTVDVGRIRLQGIVEAFNLLNTENLTSYNGVFGSNP